MTNNRLKKMSTCALASLYRKTLKKRTILYNDLSPDNIKEAIKVARDCVKYKSMLKDRANKKISHKRN